MTDTAVMNTKPAVAVYDPQALEPKWQNIWESQGLFQQTEQVSGAAGDSREKMCILFAFAYPSGSGLHVGHVESKTALDILARYYRMMGKDVFFPVGWDAFGLPAENYAIKTGIPPAETTKAAIHTFRRQIKRLAISYDWANEIATSHPEYYRWTQWIFLQLYNKGLAYRGQGMVNWCPSCQTVLANEQVVNGECERCGSQVIQKNLEQWYFKITQYQDELISGLDEVDWPEATKQHQLHWIGKSVGARVTFGLEAEGTSLDQVLEVFTTAHDTIFGCTFMVVAPEHQLLAEVQSQIKNWEEVVVYQDNARKKTELDRQVQKDKTGVLLEGVRAIHPLTGVKIPIYVADYVLSGYGTGAIMAVPGHDDRDLAFAKRYDLPVIYVTNEHDFLNYNEIKSNRQAFTLRNSQEFDGLDFAAGRLAILEALENKKAGQAQNEYKLRDWLISRQRYWGAPIPVVYDPEGHAHPVKDEHLPWLLPTDVDFKPTGESPLRSSKEFHERTERLYGKGWRPEYDTMDTFVDSSWYFLRYVDSRNSDVFARPEQIKQWLPVDLYMIGPEHIVLHLLYSRFFTKFLRDQGYLDFNEPFLKMRHQGMILGPDGKKMSKSKGNVINPDEVIEKFGADTLRVYEMFMGPLEADKPWNVTAVAGVYRFLQRVYQLVTQVTTLTAVADDTVKARSGVVRKLHQTLQKVSQDIPKLKFNTAIASMMELVNVWEVAQRSLPEQSILSPEEVQAIVKLLAPFAPFMAEELYQTALSQRTEVAHQIKSIHVESWPSWDDALAAEDSVVIPVQVNGRVRGQLTLEADTAASQTELVEQALLLPEIQKWLIDKKVVKQIYVPGKILNLVVS